MQKFKELNIKELQSVIGGINSYGNGVYCNTQKCWVNWGEAKENIAGIVISGWASGLASMGK